MSDENHNVEVKEEKCNCFCHSKGFRKFLVIALGSFVGVFCALSLFAALHKPPMMVPPCPCGCQQMVRPFYGPQFDRGDFRRRCGEDDWNCDETDSRKNGKSENIL